MSQYQKSIPHNSHDMMQELFDEINNYLGDQEKTKMISSPPLPHPSPDLSPFHLFKAEDRSSTDTLDPETHLQSGMLVESEGMPSEIGGNERNLNDSNHFQLDHTDGTSKFDDYSRHTIHLDKGSINEDARVDTNEPSPTIKGPMLRRPKSSTSFGAVNRSKLAHFAGFLKQTLTSTTLSSTDAVSATSTTKQQRGKRHSFMSFTTPVDKHNLASPNSQRTMVETATVAADIDIHDQPKLLTLPSSLPVDYYTENGVYLDDKYNSTDPHNRTPTGFEYRADDRGILYNGDDQQDSRDGFWTPATTATTATVAAVAGNQALLSGLDGINKSSDLNEDEAKAVDSFDTLLSCDLYSGEKQQILEGFLPNQLPFLTPMNRTGEQHTVTLRTKMARDAGTHEDRINAYNNAYCHCIMAKTDMVPWIKKQYSKGPPDLMKYTDYKPRHRKSSICLLGLFKRQSKSTTELPPSASNLTVTRHSNSSKLSISSIQSSIFMESTTAPYQQVTSLEYGTENQQEQQLPAYQQQNSDMAPMTRPINEVEMFPSADRAKIVESAVNDISGLEQQNPQDYHQRHYGKKKSKSVASLEEVVSGSTLKEPISSSPITLSGTVKSSCGLAFGLKNKCSLSSLIEDQSLCSSSSSKYKQYNDTNRSPLTPTSISSTSTKTNRNSNANRFSACPPPGDWSMSSSCQQQNRSMSPPLSTIYHCSRNQSTSPMTPPSPATIRRYPSSFTSPFLETTNRHHYHRHQSYAGYRLISPRFALPPSPEIYDGDRKIPRIRSSEHISVSPSYKEMNRHRSFSQLVLPPPMPPSPSKSPHRSRRLSKVSSQSNLGSGYSDSSGIAKKYYPPPPHRYHHVIADNKCKHGRRWSMATNNHGIYYDYLSTKNQSRSLSSNQQQDFRYNQAAALDDLCKFFHHVPRRVLFNYLQDAQGDFYLAKDMCMEDILKTDI